ncbi:MAG: response regulator [Prevotellaceae bacterium]|jgi:signal transduction histidine kinase/ligand-binding sensor domain-containing protein/DNA-binding response OmpR family regulator|nr:response regulator [Prevotellaceae bacterium]
MKKLLFSAACLLLFSGIFCIASPASFRFITYEVKDGLPSNTVRCILQDSYGFMWFGTENGLSRFDGYSFKNFMATPGDSTALGNNYIYSLYEDACRNLWVGTDEGVFLYRFETEQFSFFSAQTADGVTMRSHISGVKEDGRQNIWFSTFTQGVFRYNRSKNELHRYTCGLDSANAEELSEALSLCIDHSNTVWVAPKKGEGRLMRYDPAGDSFTSLPLHTAAGRLNDHAYAMREDSERNFWIGTWEHGLCRVDRSTGLAQPFLLPKTPNGIQHVHEVAEYQPHTLLVGSDDGLSVFNTRTGESSLMTVSELKRSTLSDKFIYPIYRDAEGGLWVGTYYGGVNYNPPPKGDIAGYSHMSYANSVGGNIISCFCEDERGNIWIGSDDGGLSCFNPQTKTFNRYMPHKNHNSLAYHNIHALCCDDGKLWIGTYSGGLDVLDLATNRFKHYSSISSNPQASHNSSVYAIYKDSGDMWIGTMEDICRYNREKDSFTKMKHTGLTTVDIAGDADGNVWFATWGGGLYRYSKATRQWQHFLHDPSNPSSIPHNQINSLHVDEDGQLWLGTNNGLTLYNRDSGSFEVIRLDIHSNQIYYVRNIRGALWMTTSNGLICYSLKDGAIRSFFRNDGLQSDQFNMKAGWLSSSGRLYLGTINGFNVVNPNNLSKNSCIPPVYITNLQVFNKDLKIDRHGLLPQSPLYTKQLELSHRENVLSIEYVALSYNAPSKNQHKYMLEGFDEDWNCVKSQRKATYTNLPPGRYVFRVKGSNNDGVWNEDGARLKIVIHPPFWKTPPAYYSYALLVMGVLAGVIYIVNRRVKKRHKKRMRQLQREKEKELYNAKINFFTLVAHEIRTPVALIIGPLEKVMENIHSVPDAIRDSLHIINRNSQRLLSLVNQLLDFRKAEEKSFSVNFAPCNIYELLQNLYVRFKPMVEQHNIAFSLEMEDREIIATVDAEAITKVISNLLTNALKFTKDLIKIAATSDDEYIVIKVIDNGEGIAEENIQAIFQPFFQVTQHYKSGTGIGLSLVKLLVDAHHGEVRVDSIPYRETTFTVTLPYLQADAPAPAASPDGETAPALQEDARHARAPKAEDAPAEKSLLLIVEDDVDMRKFLRDSLSGEYRIAEAANGEEGLRLLHRQAVDVIICDIMMPVMDGITLTQKVKENVHFSHIPVILLTAKIDKTSKVEGIKTGADAYIEKPFSPQMLTAQLQNLVETRKKLRKKFSEMPFAPLSSIAGTQADEQFLDKVNKAIDRNIANQDFSIDMLAEEMCISRSGLFAKVRHMVDMTPNELIQLIRLKKAAQLLLTREYRINEICYLVGFNNPSYFSKCFQKVFGVLPKDFDKRTRGMVD